jgi:alpha-tubulin suppressor-like RCC1 family protein
MSCAIYADHTLWCWGSNASFLLSESTQYYSPSQVGTKTWAALSVGYSGLCAVGTDGTLWCYDVVANDIATSTFSFQKLGTDTNWASVSVGEALACGLKTDGSAWCWGADGVGQLGNGVAGSEQSGSPVGVPGMAQWTVISAGNGVACGIQSDRSLWCWGSTAEGQVGVTSTSSILGPTELLPGQTWSTVSAGQGGCAIKTDGELWCWGQEAVVSDSYEPRPVPMAVGPQWTGFKWTTVASRIVTSGFCATGEDGSVWCFGDDDFGEMGNGVTTTETLPLTQATSSATWVTVSCSLGQTCALDDTGNIWCWGDNRDGQVGDDLPGEAPALTPVQAGTDTDWASVAPGDAEHSCALKKDGTLWCWGANGSGEIGDGTQAEETSLLWTIGGGNKASPTQETTDGTWSHASTGQGYTCAISSSTGIPWCWGNNSAGELGTNDQNSSLVPVEVVVQGGPWTSICSGTYHSCALRSDGTLWCWGASDDGALPSPSVSPQQVGTDSNWSVVACGDDDTCAVKKDGTLWCWGAANSPLGELSAGELDVPTTVGSDSDWASVVTGPELSFALKQDGTLWGFAASTAPTEQAAVGASGTTWLSLSTGSYGTCGVKSDGTLWCDHTGTLPLEMQQVSGSGWATVASAYNQICATTSAGTLWCWGANTDGELGDGAPWTTVPVQITH